MIRDLARILLALIIMSLSVTVPSALVGGSSPREDAEHAWAEDTVFTVTQVRAGVYFATGRAGRLVGANSVFVVTDRDVVVVDDHITPAAARALIGEVRRVTTLPIRYVVNTHFHYDHTNGNSAFGPEVEILSHPATRARLLASGQESIRQQLAGIPNTLATLRARRDSAAGDSARALLERQIASWDELEREYRQLSVVLPTLTVDSSLALHRGGGQEIRVFYVGRGHTAGDVVVHLPREGLLLTGDMLTNTAGPPFMVDGYPGEWGATLRRLAQLDFATTLPGHGGPLDGKQRYLATADFMDDLWAQVQALARRNVGREEVAARLDLTRHQPTFPALRGGINRAFAQRAHDLATGQAN
jgi:glyoxylase-like metal-dependent hydrolase (beta-lactamase superfamily II)